MKSTAHHNESGARGRLRAASWGRRSLLLGFVLVCGWAVATGQTPGATPPPPGTPPQPQTNPCANKNNVNNLIVCLKDGYEKVFKKGYKHIHGELGGIVPGSGLGLGLGYNPARKTINHGLDTWRLRFKGRGLFTYKKYWEVDTNLLITRAHNQFSSTSGTNVENELDESDLKINVYGQIRDMTRLDFFGLGSETQQADRAVYNYRQGVIGVDAAKAANKFIDVGGAFEHIWPHLVRIANPSVRSVERVFTETTAPGLTSQPNFLHFTAYANLHSPGGFEHRKVEYKFFYHFFHDYQDGRYSFRRFDADLRHKIPLDAKDQIRVRGRISLSDTSAGQRVPFYLMETLGGTTIRGDDTLRGFRDYRFRDRDLLLLQAEYLRQLSVPIKPLHDVLWLIGFYDTGKVAPSVSDFGQGRLRHSVGLGFVILPRPLENYQFRFTFGFGSGEGIHSHLGLGDKNSPKADRLLR
ncbi:MAG: hypothetical protein ACJ74W_15665 [Pyrinomonadaceae bacterium]